METLLTVLVELVKLGPAKHQTPEFLVDVFSGS